MGWHLAGYLGVPHLEWGLWGDCCETWLLRLTAPTSPENCPGWHLLGTDAPPAASD